MAPDDFNPMPALEALIPGSGRNACIDRVQFDVRLLLSITEPADAILRMRMEA